MRGVFGWISGEREFWRKMHICANIRGSLGVVMNFFFQLYPVARGFGGNDRLEVLVFNQSRRF